MTSLICEGDSSSGSENNTDGGFDDGLELYSESSDEWEEATIDDSEKNICEENKNKPMECLAMKCNTSIDQTYKTMILKAFRNGILLILDILIQF